MKRRLIPFLLACAICLNLQSCLFSIGTGAWRNKTIDQDVRDEMGVINKKLFKDIMTGNVKGVEQIMSDASLKKDGERIDSLVKVFGSTFKAKEFKVLDEFYVKNFGDVTQEILKSNHENSNDYQLQFVAINKKTYASVLISTGATINCMILAIYGKYDNGWKINILEIGEYSIMDQTAPEYYQLSTDHYAKGNYIDATDMITLAYQLARPGGDFFYYLNEHDMKDTYSVIMEGLETNYKFPVIIAGVKSQPQIFHITPQLMADQQHQGVFPLVHYVSRIPLRDTVSLKTENIEVQTNIGTIFHGIDKNKPCIIYRVFNKMPTDSTDANYYEFVQKIKYSTRY